MLVYLGVWLTLKTALDHYIKRGKRYHVRIHSEPNNKVSLDLMQRQHPADVHDPPVSKEFLSLL